MKAKKALKRLNKIEALISDVSERYSASPSRIRDVLQDAKAAVVRAKEAVQASSSKAKNPPVKDSKTTSRATPESSKPKRKFSAVRRKSDLGSHKEKMGSETSGDENSRGEEDGKEGQSGEGGEGTYPRGKSGEEIPGEEGGGKGPGQESGESGSGGEEASPPTTEATTVTTPEQIVPEAPVQ